MSSRRVIDLRAGAGQRSLPFSSPPRKPSKKPLPLRARRRRVRALQFLFIAILCGAAAYGVYWVSYLPQFNIQEVTVEGADKVPVQLIETFVDTELHNGTYGFLSRSNVLFYPKGAIEQGIVAFFPRIHSAIVSHPAPLAQHIIVTVVEREPFARWCTEMEDRSECYEMDESGFIFASASSTLPSAFKEAYIFSGGLSEEEPIGQKYAAGHLQGILALLALLQQQTGLVSEKVALQDEQDFTIWFTSGLALKASFGADTSLLARNLRLVLNSEALAGKAEELEYIDLRFGNRVYYKLKGEEEQSAQ